MTALETAVFFCQFLVIGTWYMENGVPDWSASLQAFSTQGVISSGSWGLVQWQAKSVRSEHPSLLRDLRKHWSEQEGTLGI